MSTKVGIISDTHGYLNPEVLRILKDCDCIIHAGDFDNEQILDTLRFMGRIYVVRGNCDREWAQNLRTRLRFQIEDVTFALVHNRGDLKGLHRGADVIISGHTHHYYENCDEGQLWLNPGSCGRPRYGEAASMVVMDIEGKEYNWTKIEL